MQQDQESDSLKKNQKIAIQLEQNKQLKVINLNAGKGSFGQVIIAEHLNSKSHYAIKVICIFDVCDQVSESKLQNAKKEAEFLKNANHPNIVKYVDEFQIGFNYFIVMEKCEKNLEELLDEFNQYQTTISKHLLVSFACQTLSAINYLHQQNQMLRDLSLRNILIDSNNQIKLCDFGLLKQVQQEHFSSLMLTSRPRGAWLYYPPELISQYQINKKQKKKGVIQDFYGDIWAFGICFYLLAGADLEICTDLHKTGYIKQQLWTTDEAKTLYKQYQARENSNQLYLAYQFISVCTQIQPFNGDYWFQLGNIQKRLQFFSEAIKSYQRYLDLNPKNDRCHRYLGNAYKAKGMLDEAIKSYQRCLELNLKNDNCHNNLGNAYSDKGMLDEAFKSYQRCLELNPKNDSCHINLGNAQKAKGKIDEVIKSYQRCLELNPNNKILKQNVVDKISFLKK
ncbi:hypothetical protein ABPG72_007274 [Tetrahymena utriculariae]